jgi:hypothetical protein
VKAEIAAIIDVRDLEARDLESRDLESRDVMLRSMALSFPVIARALARVLIEPALAMEVPYQPGIDRDQLVPAVSLDRLKHEPCAGDR